MIPSLRRARRLLGAAGLASLALAPMVAGGKLLLEAAARRPVRELRSGGLELRVNQARWVEDQMDHGTVFPLPGNMMPGMPPRGMQRFGVEITLYNSGTAPERVDPAELVLRSQQGTDFAPLEGSERKLPPGFTISELLAWDVPESAGELTLGWRRGGSWQRILFTRPPQHEAEPVGDTGAWPERVEDLPEGDPVAGEKLFNGRFACFTCHGRIDEPGTNTVGPHLRGIEQVAGTRVPGQSAPQYLYASILDPNAFIAPTCARGQPCASPSAMPEYAQLMSRQDMADLIAWLLRPSGPQENAKVQR